MEEKIFEIIKQQEGFYSNDVSDSGGETIYGISRKYNPDLSVWSTVDSFKEAGRIQDLKDNATIISEVKKFYIDMYNKYYSNIPDTPPTVQALKFKLFDEGTNIWYPNVNKKLQEAINILNPVKDALKIDGDIGPATVKELKKHNPYDLSKFVTVLVASERIKKLKAAKSKVKIDNRKKFIKGQIRRDFKEY